MDTHLKKNLLIDSRCFLLLSALLLVQLSLSLSYYTQDSEI